MRQTEITAPGPLLDCEGNLRRPGYSRSLIQTYRRKDVGASPLRLKEWDYYLVSNGRFALALTVADNGYMGLDSISFLEFSEGWEITKVRICMGLLVISQRSSSSRRLMESRPM